MATPGQHVFDRDIICKLAPVLDWQVIATKKHQQAEIGNVGDNNKQVTNEYTVGNIVYVEITGIYSKLDYKKHE